MTLRWKPKAILFLGVISSFFLAFSLVKERQGETADLGEKRIAVIIPSYNNERWCDKNIDSVLEQNYSNFELVYIDDCSTDDTYKRVRARVDASPLKNKVTVIKNETRRGALANLYYAIHALDDRIIAVTVDGDDWLAHKDVLARVNKAYQNSNVWMTYGQFEAHPQGSLGICRSIDESVIKDKSYRSAPWVTSHLRTFYAGLFKQVKREDLTFNGDFFGVTWDQAFEFPMLEMCDGKWEFISEVLYIYNQANPLNDFRARLREQLFFERVIRNKAKYEPLQTADAQMHFADAVIS